MDAGDAALYERCQEEMKNGRRDDITEVLRLLVEHRDADEIRIRHRSAIEKNNLSTGLAKKADDAVPLYVSWFASCMYDLDISRKVKASFCKQKGYIFSKPSEQRFTKHLALDSIETMNIEYDDNGRVTGNVWINYTPIVPIHSIVLFHTPSSDMTFARTHIVDAAMRNAMPGRYTLICTFRNGTQANDNRVFDKSIEAPRVFFIELGKLSERESIPVDIYKLNWISQVSAYDLPLYESVAALLDNVNDNSRADTVLTNLFAIADRFGCVVPRPQ